VKKKGKAERNKKRTGGRKNSELMYLGGTLGTKPIQKKSNNAYRTNKRLIPEKGGNRDGKVLGHRRYEDDKKKRVTNW